MVIYLCFIEGGFHYSDGIVVRIIVGVIRVLTTKRKSKIGVVSPIPSPNLDTGMTVELYRCTGI